MSYQTGPSDPKTRSRASGSAIEANFGKVQMKRTRLGNGCSIKISGIIDETFKGSTLLDGATGVVVLDLRGVHRVTSYGVREWIRALKSAVPDYLALAHCRPAIVSQLNMVANFAPQGKLLSFYAPYVCKGCGRSMEVLLDVRRDYAQLRAHTPPEVHCEVCGGVGEFDDLPDTYFAFAANAPLPTPPALVDALLEGRTVASPIRIEKEVAGTVTAFWLSGDLERAAPFKRLGDGIEGTTVVFTGGLEDITPEGLAGLTSFLATVGPAAYLAHAPMRLVTALGAREAPHMSAEVLSVQLPFFCADCGADSVHVVGANRLGLIHGGLAAVDPCRACGGKPVPRVTPEWTEAVQRLPIAQPPPAVLGFIQARADAGSQAGGAAATLDHAGRDHDFGRYRLLRPIGAGGMAEVYLARQTGVGGFEKHVVVKRILPSLSTESEFIAMFLHEARVAARISHPNVVQIFDVGQVANRFYIAMEYVRGWDLRAVTRTLAELGRSFPVEVAMRIVADVCAGLHAAHTCQGDDGRRLGIVHRDVSPHNILLSSDGQVKLTDFGIAKAADSVSHTPLTTLKGKLTYMSPEVVGHGAGTDPRSDIFSLGLILYECVTGEQPFRREGDAATVRAILDHEPPKASSRRAGLPKGLDEVLERALAKELSARYQTAQEFHDALEQLLREEPRTADVAGFLRELFARAIDPGESGALRLTPTDDQTPPSRQTAPTTAEAKKPAT